ncbi:MAG TPA: delta-60 repeat domain-containing protein [Actinomycetota bacterium]
MPQIRTLLTTAVALTLLASTPASAAPGDLDRSFGAGGKVTLSLAHGGSQGNTVLVQPDGRILIGGWAYARGFAIVRLLRDGALDRSFGDGGVATTNLPTGPAVITDLALDDRGRIDVTGLSEGSLALARYRPEGTLDPTFGHGGIVTTRYRHAQTSAEGVAVEPGGGVLAAGTADDKRWILAKFTDRGTLDRSFGRGGWATVDFGSGEEVARDLTLTPNGRIVVSGTGGQRFALARFRRDGTLDPQFGSGGTVVSRNRGSAAAVTLLRDGDVLAAGQSEGAFELRRYLPSGRPDRSFGTGGRASEPSVDGAAYDMVAARDGSAVLAGSAFQDFTVGRYLPAGSPDPAFGNDGVVHTRFPNYGFAQGVALTPDGRIVVVGQTGSRIGVARYRP